MFHVFSSCKTAYIISWNDQWRGENAPLAQKHYFQRSNLDTASHSVFVFLCICRCRCIQFRLRAKRKCAHKDKILRSLYYFRLKYMDTLETLTSHCKIHSLTRSISSRKRTDESEILSLAYKWTRTHTNFWSCWPCDLFRCVRCIRLHTFYYLEESFVV